MANETEVELQLHCEIEDAFEEEFDCERWIQIPPKVTAIEWLPHPTSTRAHMLASNEKSIKMFQI